MTATPAQSNAAAAAAHTQTIATEITVRACLNLNPAAQYAGAGVHDHFLLLGGFSMPRQSVRLDDDGQPLIDNAEMMRTHAIGAAVLLDPDTDPLGLAGPALRGHRGLRHGDLVLVGETAFAIERAADGITAVSHYPASDLAARLHPAR